MLLHILSCSNRTLIKFNLHSRLSFGGRVLNIALARWGRHIGLVSSEKSLENGANNHWGRSGGRVLAHTWHGRGKKQLGLLGGPKGLAAASGARSCTHGFFYVATAFLFARHPLYVMMWCKSVNFHLRTSKAPTVFKIANYRGAKYL